MQKETKKAHNLCKMPKVNGKFELIEQIRICCECTREATNQADGLNSFAPLGMPPDPFVFSAHCSSNE